MTWFDGETSYTAWENPWKKKIELEGTDGSINGLMNDKHTVLKMFVP